MSRFCGATTLVYSWSYWFPVRCCAPGGLDDVWQFLCRRHWGVNCLTLCSLSLTAATSAPYTTTVGFLVSYWFPVKTCTQWVHSRGSGGGAWNCTEKEEKVTMHQLLIFSCKMFFASHAFTCLLYSIELMLKQLPVSTHSERKGQRSKPPHTTINRTNMHVLCILH